MFTVKHAQGFTFQSEQNSTQPIRLESLTKKEWVQYIEKG